MDYLTYEEFCEYPLGVTVTESEFPTLEFYAEIQLDRITYGHLNKESPPPEVKKAMAIQTAFLAQNGGTELVLSGMYLSSENLGSYSYSSSGGGQTGSKSAPVSPIVYDVLQPTGLLFAGVRRPCR